MRSKITLVLVFLFCLFPYSWADNKTCEFSEAQVQKQIYESLDKIFVRYNIMSFPAEDLQDWAEYPHKIELGKIVNFFNNKNNIIKFSAADMTEDVRAYFLNIANSSNKVILNEGIEDKGIEHVLKGGLKKKKKSDEFATPNGYHSLLSFFDCDYCNGSTRILELVTAKSKQRIEMSISSDGKEKTIKIIPTEKASRSMENIPNLSTAKKEVSQKITKIDLNSSEENVVKLASILGINPAKPFEVNWITENIVKQKTMFPLSWDENKIKNLVLEGVFLCKAMNTTECTISRGKVKVKIRVKKNDDGWHLETAHPIT